MFGLILMTVGGEIPVCITYACCSKIDVQNSAGFRFAYVCFRGLSGPKFIVVIHPCDRQLSAKSGHLGVLVEQRTESPRVGGSIPPLGTISCWSISE